MFLLSIMAMAFLPVLVQSLQVSKVNASIATATQLVATQMSELRSRGTGCAALAVYADELQPEFDAGGRNLLQTIEIDCPPAEEYPTTVPVTVSVSAAATTKVISAATTLIFVTS